MADCRGLGKAREVLATLAIADKLIKTGTSRRKQNDIAGSRIGGGGTDCVSQGMALDASHGVVPGCEKSVFAFTYKIDFFRPFCKQNF